MPATLTAVNLAAQIAIFAALTACMIKHRQGPTGWWTLALGIAVVMTAAHITNVSTNPNPAGTAIAALWLVQVGASALALRYAVQLRATRRQNTNR